MDNLLTVQQLSEIIGFPPSALRRMCRERVIPCYKVGRFYRFYIGEVEAWLELKKQKVVTMSTVRVVKRLIVR